MGETVKACDTGQRRNDSSSATRVPALAGPGEATVHHTSFRLKAGLQRSGFARVDAGGQVTENGNGWDATPT